RSRARGRAPARRRGCARGSLPLSASPRPEDTSPDRLRARRGGGPAAQGAPLVAQLPRRLRPVGIAEEEAVLGQPAGDDAPALEQQLGLGAMNERRDLQQPAAGAEAEGDAAPRAEPIW